MINPCRHMICLMHMLTLSIAAASPGGNTKFRHALVHVCMGNLWAKVYCRQDATDYRSWRMVVMSTLLSPCTYVSRNFSATLMSRTALDASVRVTR